MPIDFSVFESAGNSRSIHGLPTSLKECPPTPPPTPPHPTPHPPSTQLGWSARGCMMTLNPSVLSPSSPGHCDNCDHDVVLQHRWSLMTMMTCISKYMQGSTLSFLAGCPKSHFLSWNRNFLLYWYLKLDNQVVNSTCPKDKLGWIWRADDP